MVLNFYYKIQNVFIFEKLLREKPINKDLKDMINNYVIKIKIKI